MWCKKRLELVGVQMYLKLLEGLHRVHVFSKSIHSCIACDMRCLYWSLRCGAHDRNKIPVHRDWRRGPVPLRKSVAVDGASVAICRGGRAVRRRGGAVRRVEGTQWEFVAGACGRSRDCCLVVGACGNSGAPPGKTGAPRGRSEAQRRRRRRSGAPRWRSGAHRRRRRTAAVGWQRRRTSTSHDSCCADVDFGRRVLPQPATLSPERSYLGFGEPQKCRNQRRSSRHAISFSSLFCSNSTFSFTGSALSFNTTSDFAFSRTSAFSFSSINVFSFSSSLFNCTTVSFVI